MANQLKMAVVHGILTLARLGWSQRRIAQELGIDRETVARYVHSPPGDSNPAANPIPGSEAVPGAVLEANRAGNPISGSEAAGLAAENPISGPESLCEPFRAVIEGKVGQGLSGQRIYQDLVEGHGFAASYSSVRRSLQRLGQGQPLPFRRLEVLPGEQAQVDFGTGAPILRADGKRRRPYVFRVVLSFSRKAYSAVVYHQTTENFLRCLENAFWYFGGVPQTIVIDNLKAAVRRADGYDPDVHPKIPSFCQHYGTVILPTKPRMPRHKGKVEKGIDYVQSNALKGHTFASLAEENQHLQDWEQRIADSRIHGTTRQQVHLLFQEEKPRLTPLPAGRFPSFEEGRRSVHRDGHIEVAKAYYSVPPEYTGRQVWVRWDGHLVRVFNSKMESIAVHVQVEPGTFQTQDQHLHSQKISQVEQGTVSLLRRAALLGTHAEQWARHMLEARGIQGVRVLVGLPGTGKSHLCQALGYQAVKQGFVVLYRSIFDVVRDFLEDEAFAGQNQVLSQYLKPDLLIIDDMGIKQLPKRSGECLFEIILRRYETKSTMMTSNRPLEDWGKLLGDVPAATAILDRFLHHAEILAITGRSYRLKDKATKEPDPSKEQTKDEPDKDSK